MSAGMASFIPFGMGKMSPVTGTGENTSSREVWIAGFSQMWLSATTADEMIAIVLKILKDATVYSPDFVCLPEAFPFGMTEKKYTMGEKLEISVKAIEQLSDFSRLNNCHTICPVYTSAEGKNYNSAVFINRKGEKAGVYNKIHPTVDEIEAGISPGAVYQQPINTEFGPVGAQICFDINWDDGWLMLQKQGARIVFWPSAFDGGKMVNTKAWEHKYVVATSSFQNNSKLCDITGETVTQTGIWNKYLFCGKVNLEKAFIHLWPYVERFRDIREKYGRKVNITIYHEEQWAIIESLSPDIEVKDLLKEFDILTHEEHIKQGETAQNTSRD
jgi:predicted amidohydrolase